MFCRLQSFFLAGVLLLTPAASHAVTIYDNLSQSAGGSDSITATQWNANKFVTDSTAYQLTGVTLRLSSTNTTAALDVLLYSDSANAPGSLLGNLGTTSAIGGSSSDITFNPSVSLLANTSYWVVTRTSGSGGYAWHFPGSTTGTGAAFSVIYSRSNNGGSSWATNGNPAFAPYYMQLAAADVPEPGTMLLGGIGLALLGLSSRRARA